MLIIIRRKHKYTIDISIIAWEKEAAFQVNIVAKYRRGKWKRHGIEYLAFAVHGVDIPVARTHREYRKRFGVESSYKLMNTARARNSSRISVLRLLYVALSFLLSIIRKNTFPIQL